MQLPILLITASYYLISPPFYLAIVLIVLSFIFLPLLQPFFSLRAHSCEFAIKLKENNITRIFHE